MQVGYARVSSQDQDLSAQVEMLQAAGCDTIFKEKVSGKNCDRVELTKVINKLQAGDTLIVVKLDRLCRNLRDLLNILHSLGERGIGFRSLRDSWCDTSNSHGKLLLTIIGAIAEFERELILARTSEGRVRAKAKGIKFGRKMKLTDYQQAEVFERLAKNESHTSIARSFNVHQTTISALAKKRPSTSLVVMR